MDVMEIHHPNHLRVPANPGKNHGFSRFAPARGRRMFIDAIE
jgi:hypothetical protein